jgi:hypothetical protein
MFMTKHVTFLEMYVLTEVLLCHGFGTSKNGTVNNSYKNDVKRCAKLNSNLQLVTATQSC